MGSLASGFRGTVAGINIDKNGNVRQAGQTRTGSSVRTAENRSEFGNAGRATKFLRAALPLTLLAGAGKLTTSRISKKMAECIKLDLTSVRGQRNVLDGELTLLEGFDFNMDAAMGSVFSGIIDGIFDRATGVGSVLIPAHIPANIVSAPIGTTHYQFVTEGALVDFESGASETNSEVSAMNVYNGTLVEAQAIPLSLSPNDTRPAFVTVGIEFYQELNGVKYKLNNNSFNAAKILMVETGV